MRYVLLTFAMLVGCAQNSGIVQVSNDTYIVSRQAATGFSGMGTLKADALREAYAKCSSTGKDVELIDRGEQKWRRVLSGAPQRTPLFTRKGFYENQKSWLNFTFYRTGSGLR